MLFLNGCIVAVAPVAYKYYMDRDKNPGLTPLESNKAAVYIYRKGRIVGAAGSPFVGIISDGIIDFFPMENDGYVKRIINPGSIALIYYDADYSQLREKTFVAEAGTNYVFEWSFSAKMFKSEWSLTEHSSDIATLKTCHPVADSKQQELRLAAWNQLRKGMSLDQVKALGIALPHPVAVTPILSDFRPGVTVTLSEVTATMLVSAIEQSMGDIIALVFQNHVFEMQFTRENKTAEWRLAAWKMKWDDTTGTNVYAGAPLLILPTISPGQQRITLPTPVMHYTGSGAAGINAGLMNNLGKH